MPGFLSPGKGELLLIPEYSGINKGQRVPDRSKTAHRKPFVKCFLTPCHKVMRIFIILWKKLIQPCPHGPTLCGGYEVEPHKPLIFLINVFIYLFGCSESCSTQTL